jgi:hypothetical protein
MGMTSKLPRDYVDYLTKTGIKTRGGTVLLNRYMGAHKNGENSAAFFAALDRAKLHDLDDTSWNAHTGISALDWAIMIKGQGFHVAYKKLWDFLWENQEQMGDSKEPVLRKVYDYYFVRKAGGPNPLQGMVNDAYFGNECIGFVSNYLRWVDAWQGYHGADNHHWVLNHPYPVNSLKDIQPLDLLEWEPPYGHVALIDFPEEPSGGTLKITYSQSSGMPDGTNGPMTNIGHLTPVGNVGGETVYNISGNIPVDGKVKVRRMKGFTYSSPRYAYTPLSYDKKDSSATRR